MTSAPWVSYSLCLVIFAIDISTPLGIADGILYAIPVLLSVNAMSKRHILWLGIATAVLTLAGFYLSPPNFNVWNAALNRLFSIIAVGIVTEQTIRRRISDEREEAYRSQLEQQSLDLQRSNRDLEHFAFVASHDLQAPLRKIANYTHVLKTCTDLNDEAVVRALEVIPNQVHHMQTLITDLLAFSRLSGNYRAHQLVNLTHVLARAMDNLEEPIRLSRAVIRSVQLPTVTGDSSQLLLLFQNLLINAIKYAKPGEAPEVDIQIESYGNEWMFTFEDRGIGIAKQHTEIVFVMFQRIGSSPNAPGSGMGLSICKKVVERLRGRIWIESTVGVGTKVKFTLPKEHRRIEIPRKDLAPKVLPSLDPTRF
jgi:signal transduction histidine kinase